MKCSAQAYDLGNGGTGVAHTHILAGDNRILPYAPSSRDLTNDERDLTNGLAQPVSQGHDGSAFGDVLEIIEIGFYLI